MMQEVYARILAGETRAPGSVSLRTLRALRYMDQATAELFQRAVSLAITSGNPFLAGSTPLLRKYGLGLEAIIELDEAGLVSANTVAFTESGSRAFFSYGRWLLRLTGKAVYNTSVFVFTNAGSELARVATNVARSRDYFFDASRFFRGQAGCEVHWLEADADGIFPSGDDAWRELPPE